ncbi:ribosome biogenesis protein ytm1 [Fusarium irregulare]|uniref:Ribosome biogenesis protein ytm1 n=1 Tax=Fusarium irregulare TaxID=2494466 RepID=A0A9W8Q258_9HYPO|nr:ribosome biogenesis protein ytm1 [Fusarium irregulare]KAJ4025581.1 ribosome biogenesis protein ytm1 [Fusarium irregulare]
MAATTEAPQKLSDALVAFSLEGRFPDDISVLPPVSETDLQPAIQALAEAKQGLEAELHTINQETKQDVDSWVRNSKALQEDIFRSKAMANEIERQSEAPDVSGEAVQDAEEKAEFLNREVQYSQQLHDVLQKIKLADQSLGEMEESYQRSSIQDSIVFLKAFEKAFDDIGVSKSCRVMKLLKLRSFELNSAVREMIDHHWKTLVNADIETRQFTIRKVIEDEHGEVQMDLLDVAYGLEFYKEVDEHMEQLWRNLDATVISPRMDIKNTTFPSIQEYQDILKLSGEASRSVDALLTDLETAFSWVSQKVPEVVFPPLANFMVADVIPRLIGEWLAPAVPSSLKDMDSFQAMIQRTQKFCQLLTEYKYTGLEDLQNWVDNAPSIWLGKCRETTLDSVRSKLLGGIGESKQVEKVEKQMVSIAEGKEITKTPGGAGATAETADWGDAWGDAWEEDNEQPEETQPTQPTKKPGSTKADEDDGADAWGWDEEDTTAEPKDTKEATEKDDEDDAAAAWGWGDEDTVQEPESAAKKIKTEAHETRELVLKETYSVSSMPEPVLELIQAILEDGAALTRDDVEYAPVAATAPGLFGLPTFALALFRAISPYYYSLSEGGNMFLYNDAMYLAERLSEFADAWKKREDLTPRARNMLRLDNDVKSLQSFANRSYANEMNIQKTILRDFLGGAQSLMQQDEMESCVELATGRIRAMASVWKSILARSVWTQALGSLVDAVATKLITDVLEMSSIGQDEAYNIAKVIATATELDDLFLPSVLAGTPSTEDEVPQTAQYAPSWLRLKYLSEVLQSNLNEVRYLWFESELSLYFSASEVVDLIEASFESNPRTRETIREIQSKPAPAAER